jgi:hypothetical protein
LKFGAWAQKPLIHRISELQMPVHFLYGETDWMDSNTALEV